MGRRRFVNVLYRAVVANMVANGIFACTVMTVPKHAVKCFTKEFVPPEDSDSILEWDLYSCGQTALELWKYIYNHKSEKEEVLAKTFALMKSKERSWKAVTEGLDLEVHAQPAEEKFKITTI
eukprot:TRINITY_DN10041_c0_g2_i1.p1 TRINITY_DN10041_c0_g2~~TRINITY_DN10041_c0_g2_i1.p1  ORF type:complete len:122 (-),score=16.79 TRINITY_DN10041_c0_g2_i1:39-404(-)